RDGGDHRLRGKSGGDRCVGRHGPSLGSRRLLGPECAGIVIFSRQMAHDRRMSALEVLPEVDLAIVHALQVAPRASWQRIGAVIGLDPATAARRWARLEEQRVAWLTIWPA